MYRKCCSLVVLLTAIFLVIAGAAKAQEYPVKLIRYVVPYSAGATLDIVARVTGNELSKVLGQPIIIENRAGADGIIGFEYVAKQVPKDGYTIVIAAVSNLATLPVTVKELRFDPLKDLPPVTSLVEGRYIFGSASTLPWKNFGEFVAHAKANPGRLNYGASSTTVRLHSEALVRELGLNVVYIPYKEASAYIPAVGSGQVHMGFMAEGSAISLGDKMRVLATTGTQRRETFRDAPTFAELGLPRVRGVNYSLNVPAGVPKTVMDKLHSGAVKALQQPELKSQMAKIRLDVVGDSPEVAAKRLADEAQGFADVARMIGLKPE